MRPPSARSVYINTMNELKLTPKPTSIIAKYKEERMSLSFGHVITAIIMHTQLLKALLCYPMYIVYTLTTII